MAIVAMIKKAKKVGAGLGKTTGWIHRSSLKKKKVQYKSTPSHILATCHLPPATLLPLSVLHPMNFKLLSL